MENLISQLKEASKVKFTDLNENLFENHCHLLRTAKEMLEFQSNEITRSRSSVQDAYVTAIGCSENLRIMASLYREATEERDKVSSGVRRVLKACGLYLKWFSQPEHSESSEELKIRDQFNRFIRVTESTLSQTLREVYLAKESNPSQSQS